MCSILTLIFLYIISLLSALSTQNIVIIILSQSNIHNSEIAHELKKNIDDQAGNISQEIPVVYLSHLDLPHVGAWTIIPLIPKLFKLHPDMLWYVFIEERTHVNLYKLLDTLNMYESSKQVWLGHATYDREATIIHHFAFYENPSSFVYPLAASGFALSNTLMQNLTERLKKDNLHAIDFSIDSGYELALFIWDKGKGPMITNDIAFCIKKTQNCATFVESTSLCKQNVEISDIYFAVKTCKKFHNVRVPVVKNTWGKYADNIKYFSDVEDKHIPSVSLGIKNTEKGHCAKTVAIVKYFAWYIEEIYDVKWIVIVDDDTILSVARLGDLLSCYSASEPVAIGERYGFDVVSGNGYNYITGGGGMVFSSVLIKKLAKDGVCECPSIDTPDDMFLGMCLEKLGVNITHLSQFHQARPIDYTPEVLETSTLAISFHKHWMIDPGKVYKEWFAEDDKKLHAQRAHSEL